MTFVPGKSYHTRPYWSFEKVKIHVLAIVDERYIVYKYWARTRWRYMVESQITLEGELERLNKKK